MYPASSSMSSRHGFRPTLETVEGRCLLSGYSITTLTYTGGYLHTAGAINNLGQVAGRGSYPLQNNAVVWQNGSIIDLDPQQLHGLSYGLDLTDPAPGHESEVQVVGGLGNGDVFLWVGGTMYDTGIRRTTPGLTTALSISDGGVVAGAYASGGDTTRPHAYIWNDTASNHILDPGELQDLNGLFPGATDSSAEDIIDASGPGDHTKIVANAYVPAAGGGREWRGYLLVDQGNDGFVSGVTVSDLGVLRGPGGTMGLAINTAGQVTGGSGGKAFRWQNGAMANLGRLGNDSALATAINDDGNVVGLAGSGSSSRAWIWTGSGSLKDLNSLIPKNSGWTSLADSNPGIDDQGRIVGTGSCPSLSNDTAAFLLTPGAAAVLGMASKVPVANAGAARLPSGQSEAMSPTPTLVLPRRASPNLSSRPFSLVITAPVPRPRPASAVRRPRLAPDAGRNIRLPIAPRPLRGGASLEEVTCSGILTGSLGGR